MPSFSIDKATLENALVAVSHAHILVVGDVMLDRYLWGDASRLSPEAPVPVVKVDRTSHVAGGAANVALNLRALGASVSLFGTFGDDEPGDALAALLADAGVSVLPGSRVPGVRTIVKTRVLCRRQQLCRLDIEDPPSALRRSADDLRAAVGQWATGAMRQFGEGAVGAPPVALLLSDYAKGLLTTESVALLQSLAPAGALVAMDPKPRGGISHSGLGLLTPNRAEAFALAGLDDPGGPDFPADEVCRRIHERFHPARLDVTLGAGGMLLCENGRPLEHIPTVAREVFDVSGAGDTVVAALTAALAGGVPYPAAARFANLAAGVVDGKLGTATASPDELLAAL